MKHTPGPWIKKGGHDNVPFHVARIYRDKRNRRCTQFIAEVLSTKGHENETEANAHLIASALDLLEALKSVSKCKRGKHLPAEIVAHMMEAIQKAEEK